MFCICLGASPVPAGAWVKENSGTFAVRCCKKEVLMCQNTILARTLMDPAEYSSLETETKYKSYKIVTYPETGSVTINGVQLCELHTEVVSPEGEKWWDVYPIYSSPTEDPKKELGPAYRTAQWVIDHWKQAMEEFHAC